MAASIIKTTQIRVLETPDNDPTTATVALDRWMYIETCIVIIAASIPCIRPLFKIGRHKNHSHSYELGSSYEYSGGRAEERKRVARLSRRYGVQSAAGGPDDGSEDDILEREHDKNVPNSGIVKRVDISTEISVQQL